MLSFKKEKLESKTETQVTQAELRLLMLRQSLLYQRLRVQTDSPLSKFSNGDQLPCDMPKRSIDDSSYNEYINSKGSKKNIFKSKQESSVKTLKRPLDIQESSAKPVKKLKGIFKPVASVPSSFFQRSSSTSSMKTNIDNETKEKVQKQPESLDDPNFDNGILSKGYDSPLLYPKSEKNSSDTNLQKLFEQPIMVKTDGELNGKCKDPLQIMDKQVEEIEYLSNNSGNLINAVRTQSINYRSPLSSKIFKRNISKRKVELSETNDKKLVTINNRLKRALAKSDSLTSSKKLKVTPIATMTSNFFESPTLFSSSNPYFDQKINEKVEKQPERSVDDLSLFTTIRNNSNDDSSSEEELPSFENNSAVLNITERLMAAEKEDYHPDYFSSKRERNDYVFWQRVLDMEKRRSTMGLSIASTTELMENMEINNEAE